MARRPLAKTGPPLPKGIDSLRRAKHPSASPASSLQPQATDVTRGWLLRPLDLELATTPGLPPGEESEPEHSDQHDTCVSEDPTEDPQHAEDGESDDQQLDHQAVALSVDSMDSARKL